ncbi:hypothetical protein H5410_017501 [Solanum commersonii]|uniref:Uncharacterized protein n=1 Tax=Solanum commersonii TaxID=4109 RepID=A0A9J5ZZB7_SOLCO|nr:hypothetical protein H5410_017501 [Solanum commersonii]
MLLVNTPVTFQCNHIQAIPATCDDILVVLVSLMEQYKCIFDIPTALPPHVGPSDHRIPLIDNASPISKRPYRFPGVKKDIIEKLILWDLASGTVFATVENNFTVSFGDLQNIQASYRLNGKNYLKWAQLSVKSIHCYIPLSSSLFLQTALKWLDDNIQHGIRALGYYRDLANIESTNSAAKLKEQLNADRRFSSANQLTGEDRKMVNTVESSEEQNTPNREQIHKLIGYPQNYKFQRKKGADDRGYRGQNYTNNRVQNSESNRRAQVNNVNCVEGLDMGRNPAPNIPHFQPAPCFTADQYNHLMKLIDKESSSQEPVANIADVASIWHQRLGHAPNTILQKIASLKPHMQSSSAFPLPTDDCFPPTFTSTSPPSSPSLLPDTVPAPSTSISPPPVIPQRRSSRSVKPPILHTDYVIKKVDST